MADKRLVINKKTKAFEINDIVLDIHDRHFNKANVAIVRKLEDAIMTSSKFCIEKGASHMASAIKRGADSEGTPRHFSAARSYFEKAMELAHGEINVYSEDQVDAIIAIDYPNIVTDEIFNQQKLAFSKLNQLSKACLDYVTSEPLTQQQNGIYAEMQPYEYFSGLIGKRIKELSKNNSHFFKTVAETEINFALASLAAKMRSSKKGFKDNELMDRAMDEMASVAEQYGVDLSPAFLLVQDEFHFRAQDIS
ncbi:MAG: hypothetical protein KGH98_02945 [Candidatus Micrarchaeota archaeon]|nr:hypothetical protein [Candidatus Micrarchaeota archaeon]